MPTARYTTPVETRVAGGQVNATNFNTVEARILQLAVDLWYRRSIAPAAFRALDGAEVGDISLTTSSPNYVTSTAGATTSRILEAPLDLPHGCAWTALNLYGNIQTSTSSYVKVAFIKVALATGVPTQIGTDCTLTGSTGDGNAEVTFAAETIDNSAYAYKLRLALYNHTAVSQARLYSVTLN